MSTSLNNHITFFRMNSNQLKTIALISMILDHISFSLSDYMVPEVAYSLSIVGRIAFPIYCFVLVEGFFHTRNRQNYILRLALFGMISELPFDLAFYSNEEGLFYPDHQNVFFALMLGFMAMWILERYQSIRHVSSLTVILLPLIGELLCFDYGACGTLTIILLYYRKKYGNLSLVTCMIPLLLIAAISDSKEVFALASLIFINAYNGEKGQGSQLVKYLFYAAYPVHLMILYLIKCHL